MTTHETGKLEQQARQALRLEELPTITPVDRLALRLGTRLILWGARRRQHHADHADRAEQARLAQAARSADCAAADAFERRTLAGPRW
jgi:hypothetical protein